MIDVTFDPRFTTREGQAAHYAAVKARLAKGSRESAPVVAPAITGVISQLNARISELSDERDNLLRVVRSAKELARRATLRRENDRRALKEQTEKLQELERAARVHRMQLNEIEASLNRRSAELSARYHEVARFVDFLPHMAIAQAVANAWGISTRDLFSHRQTLQIAGSRQELMFRLRYETDLSSVEIGKFVKRDHTTVLHGVGKVESLLLAGRRMKSLSDVIGVGPGGYVLEASEGGV